MAVHAASCLVCNVTKARMNLGPNTQDFRNYKEMHTYETKDCQKKKNTKKTSKIITIWLQQSAENKNNLSKQENATTGRREFQMKGNEERERERLPPDLQLHALLSPSPFIFWLLFFLSLLFLLLLPPPDCADSRILLLSATSLPSSPALRLLLLHAVERI